MNQRPMNQCAAHSDCPTPVTGIKTYCKWHKMAEWRQYAQVAKALRENQEFFQFLDELAGMTMVEMITGDQICNRKFIWEWNEGLRHRWHQFAPIDSVEAIEGYVAMDGNNAVVLPDSPDLTHYREAPDTYLARMDKTARQLLGIYVVPKAVAPVDDEDESEGLRPVEAYS